MNGYQVVAKKWAEGWELHIEDVGVTQVRRLDKADETVRSYLRLDGASDWATGAINIVPDLNGLEIEVSQTREEVKAASAAQIQAAERSRNVARKLRRNGLSITETAVVLGVSRSRVSQLIRYPNGAAV